MSGWLTSLGPDGTVLALLLLGYVLSDLVFQTYEITENRLDVVFHLGTATIIQVVIFIPLLTPRAGVIVILIGVSHFLINTISTRLERSEVTSAHYLFLSGQVAHLFIVLVGWFLISPLTWTATPVVATLDGIVEVPWQKMTAGALYASAFVFAHESGNTIVRGVLPEDGPDSGENDLEAGNLIGSLERWIILLLGLAGIWEAIALVVAVESIARFEELKEQAFAEYFLVGTLTSVLIAIVLVISVSILV